VVAVASANGSDINDIPPARLARQTGNEHAFQEYLQGRYFFNMRSREGLQRAVTHFQRAFQLDPSYAEAQAGLADCYNLMVFYGWISDQEGVAKAMSAAQTALHLNEDSSEAHSAYAYSLFFWKHDWIEADHHFRQAIRLDPDSVQARHWYAMLLVASGHTEEAQAQMATARSIAPLSRSVLIGSAYIDYFSHDYTKSIEECNQVLSMHGDLMPAYAVRGLSFEQTGRPLEALTDFEKALKLQGGSSPTYLAYIGHADAMLGRRAEAQQIIRRLKTQGGSGYDSPVNIAAIYLQLGVSYEADNWLARAVENNDLNVIWLRADPRFSRLQPDPSFQQLTAMVFLGATPQETLIP
jgi:tetratricopeptide (TPR) repeat protein